MKCAWQAYLNLLPHWMRQEVDRLGCDSLLELRLRIDYPPELVLSTGSDWLQRVVTRDDLLFCINAASSYSPWTASSSASGYLTAPGGHRIGLCGMATVINNEMTAVGSPTSLCLRVARDFPGIGMGAAKRNGSLLILGKPGSGKTTLLRDIIRCKSETGHGSIAVVDERGELFPTSNHKMCFAPGKRTDVITGCEKAQGIVAVLRSMNPEYIAVDEITAEEDCQALIRAGWCGVKLMATAHAGSKADFLRRPVYKPLVSSGIFDTLLVLQPDKTWTLERMNI